MIDIIVSITFLSMSAMYFYVAQKKKQSVSIETEFVGIFGMVTVAYCFLFGYMGFLNPALEAFGILPYLVLSFSGTLASLNAIREFNRQQKTAIECKTYIQLKKIFLITTIVFIMIEYGILLLSIMMKSNTIMILTNLFTPIYLIFIMIINFFLVYEKGIDIFAGKSYFLIVRNYLAIAVSIGMYEFIDLFVFFANYKLYSEWGKYYENPSKIFDIAWIMGNIALFLFLPRILLLLKRGKK